jgi:TIR domain
MSSSSRKPLVFISYARKDSRRADALQRSLLPRNLEVWVDRSRLVGGQAWPIGLQQAVEKCDLMLVLLSPRSLASAYVRREYLHALTRYSRRHEGPDLPLC